MFLGDHRDLCLGLPSWGHRVFRVFIQALRILGLEFAAFEILRCCRVVWVSGLVCSLGVQVAVV